jgi:hypothetical protein
MLLKGRLRSFEEEVVYTFVEVFACHVVIDDAKTVYEDGSLISGIDVVLYLGQFTLLFDNFNRLSAVLA